MQKVLMMILKDCPHCHKALALMEELKTEHPEYGKAEVRIADESVETELAESMDYWYVPTFYVGDKKVHEGVPTKENVEKVFKEALTGL